ncbi:hypothetical protein D1632_08690 [Chryseobacterium nematophagum]|uniref:Uncharacterized protein n=2 Tax=Chryseobacterium nematophagum TaxID=2305228 RepID=A0A3M7LA83_9FLAO|nr:hypothetical protein D1632_08690 [Chryseobacterium nematophagum]
MFSLSCTEKNKNQNFINKLSSVQNGSPSLYFNYYLYFKMDNNEILETNIDLIYEIYKNYYSKKYTDFTIYLEELLNEKVTIKSEYINTLKKNNVFLANLSTIDDTIEKMSTENIEKKYLNLEQKDAFVLQTGKIEATKVKTILYKMFTNDYIITFSDYGGYYNIKRQLCDEQSYQ